MTEATTDSTYIQENIEMRDRIDHDERDQQVAGRYLRKVLGIDSAVQ